MAGNLHVISLNGGLLLLPEAVREGSVVEVTLHTHRGTVSGTAEMLVPVVGTQQPFRFVTLPDAGQRTLHAAFQSGLYRNTDAEERIEELRAAVAHALAKWNPSPWHRRLRARLVMGLVLLMASVVCTAFCLHLFPHTSYGRTLEKLRLTRSVMAR